MNIVSSAIGSTLLITAFGLCFSVVQARADHQCDKQSIIPLGGSGIGGHAVLCINSGNVRAEVQAKKLMAGDAYTIWFVYFDDPSQCVHGGPGVCGPTDFTGDKPLGVFGRFDSLVAPHSGKAHFSGRVRDLQPSQGSRIWLLMFGHGLVDAADGAHRARQLLTPEDPGSGSPHLGNVIDGQLGFPVAVIPFSIP